MQSARILTLKDVQSQGDCVVYVMSRDQRVADNHALLAAQTDALARRVPLIVVFNLYPQLGVRAREHYQFMLAGLRQVEGSLARYNIPMILTVGDASAELPKLCRELGAAALYTDFSPLRDAKVLREALAAQLAVPFYVVDTHNVIPLWTLSDKKEFAAHTIRRKVHTHLQKWLVEPEQIVPHPYSLRITPVDWRFADTVIAAIPANGSRLQVLPGEAAAHERLNGFIETGLSRYAAERNDPNATAQSGLSPYLHFGQISSLRVALNIVTKMQEPPLLLKQAKLIEIGQHTTFDDNANSLLEELIVRKELADNYCFYTPEYDSLDGAWPWARQTLADHAADLRPFLYTLVELEACRTHDELWNVAQEQMMTSGIMPGYLRMYWAKKILEWSSTPAEALKTAVYLNDHYSLDGGDPNGYTGIMWSIAGVHDRPWFDRAVFGTVRYMNASGLRRKFDTKRYVESRTKEFMEVRQFAPDY